MFPFMPRHTIPSLPLHHARAVARQARRVLLITLCVALAYLNALYWVLQGDASATARLGAGLAGVVLFLLVVAILRWARKVNRALRAEEDRFYGTERTKTRGQPHVDGLFL
jgi:F0F1-type ATP synthase assembly protein I